MKVITIQEPWASLIGEGIKTIETRSWKTNYRGELYIHSGLSPIRSKDEKAKEMAQLLSGPFHSGFIFAKCELVNCLEINDELAAQLFIDDPINFKCGDYSIGRYAWILNNVQRINPIPAKGQLSIWNYNIK